MDYTAFVERAQRCAQNERHQARWRRGDRTSPMTVVAETQPGFYHQSFEILATGALWFHCDCKSGKFREHLLVPCKHSTRWGDRMVRDLGTRSVKFVDGIYWEGDADTSDDIPATIIGWAAAECYRRIEERSDDGQDPFRGLPR